MLNEILGSIQTHLSMLDLALASSKKLQVLHNQKT